MENIDSQIDIKQDTAKTEPPYVALSADYNIWQKYFYSDMERALKGMEAEIMAMEIPGERDTFRWLWARLQYPNSDHEKTWSLFNKYTSRYNQNAQYLPVKLGILEKLDKIDLAIDIVRPYLLAGRDDLAPRLAGYYARKSQAAEAASLMQYQSQRGRILEKFFMSAPGETPLFEDFIAALPDKILDDAFRMQLVKWLNIREQYLLADLLAHSSGGNIPHPRFDAAKATKLDLRTGVAKDQPLLITFPPMVHKLLAEFSKNNPIENIEILLGSRIVAYPHFFESFNGINLLHVLDDYQAWGLLNTELLLFHLKKIIHTLKPSKLMTFGSSSGGFVSLLFGYLLNADLAIATAPHTIAFHDYTCEPYHSDLCQRYSLAVSPFAYLKRILSKPSPNAKTEYSVYYSSECPADIFHAGQLTNIKNMHQTSLKVGNSHGLIYAYGKDKMRAMIKDDIREHCGIDCHSA